MHIWLCACRMFEKKRKAWPNGPPKKGVFCGQFPPQTVREGFRILVFVQPP